jgi:hypothetical protein
MIKLEKAKILFAALVLVLVCCISIVHYVIFQSIGVLPTATIASFALLKHLEPKNGELVFVAPSGLTWRSTNHL